MLLEDLTLQEREEMWLQHDGCPVHFYVRAREILNLDHNQRWIGRVGIINWPARSPDLTPIDFFLRGLLIEKAYAFKPTTPENIRDRTRNACHELNGEILRRTHDSFIVRAGKCIEADGHYFEHFIKS